MSLLFLCRLAPRGLAEVATQRAETGQTSGGVPLLGARQKVIPDEAAGA